MVSESIAPLLSRVLDPLARYHRHRVEGFDYIPVLGPALLVLHHSLATYDGLLLASRIWHKTGRAPVGLGHDRFFDLAPVAALAEKLGIHQASPEAGRSLLADGQLVMVAPGGMAEALRPSDQRYQVRWENRRGFVRLALEAQVPMVLAACPRADDLFDVEAHPLTEWAYDALRFPVPFARGRRGLPVPRRVELVHHIAPPIHPPAPGPDVEAQVEALHAQAVQVMVELLERR